MSSPHMSFRLNHYQLAKALRSLVTLEPDQPIASLSQAMKIIITDWISKHSINAPLECAQADINAVKLILTLPVDQIDPYTTIRQIMAQAKAQSQPFQAQQEFQIKEQAKKSAQQIQRDIEDTRLFEQLRREHALKEAQEAKDKEIDTQIELSLQTRKPLPKPSEFHDPNITESDITTVTDFSPSKDWIDSEE